VTSIPSTLLINSFFIASLRVTWLLGGLKYVELRLFLAHPEAVRAGGAPPVLSAKKGI
jgi:hypothetical protein